MRSTQIDDLTAFELLLKSKIANSKDVTKDESSLLTTVLDRYRRELKKVSRRLNHK